MSFFLNAQVDNSKKDTIPQIQYFSSDEMVEKPDLLKPEEFENRQLNLNMNALHFAATMARHFAIEGNVNGIEEAIGLIILIAEEFNSYHNNPEFDKAMEYYEYIKTELERP